MRWFRARREASELPPLRTEGLVYAVGDIHGRADLLDKALAWIERDRRGQPAQIVFLGDYMDRGPDSAGVLQRLHGLSLPDAQITCLMGNHERMMLDFLRDPDAHGDRWLGNGGTETLASFIPGRAASSITNEEESRLSGVARALGAAIGPELSAWLERLPLQWRSGQLGCVHAITDPAQPWDAQTEATLLWGRPSARLGVRSDGIWVAHGHTIVPEPAMIGGRIALDTGAYRTGRLSGLRCGPSGATLFTVRADDQ